MRIEGDVITITKDDVEGIYTKCFTEEGAPIGLLHSVEISPGRTVATHRDGHQVDIPRIVIGLPAGHAAREFLARCPQVHLLDEDGFSPRPPEQA